MRDDKILAAGIIGVISSIITEIASYLATFMGFTQYSLYRLSSMIITLDRPSMLIGFFVSSAVAGLFSVLLYLAFKKLGSDHLTIKCIGTSIVMWIALELIFTSYIEARFIHERPINAYYGHLICAIVFGIIEGTLLERFLFSNYVKGDME